MNLYNFYMFYKYFPQIFHTVCGKSEANLQTVERNKIRCGELHFKAVFDRIKFGWVNSYEDFRNKFGVSESN